MTTMAAALVSTGTLCLQFHIQPSRATLRASCSGRVARPQTHALRQCTFRPQGQFHRTSIPVVRASAGPVEVDVEEEAFERMEKSLDAVKAKFASVRTGRANPAMLDRIQVEYYGAPTPLKQIAGVSVPESTMLVIQPYDISAMKEIEKAIMNSDLGIMPSNDGKIIRLKIPELTIERRKEMAKTVSKLGEDGKIAIRNVRRDAMKDIEKMEASEDEKKGLEDSIQKLTDDYIKQIDTLVKDKQAELTKV